MRVVWVSAGLFKYILLRAKNIENAYGGGPQVQSQYGKFISC